MVDVAPHRPGGRVGVHAGPHELIVFVVGGFIGPVVAGCDVFAVVVVVEHIHDGVDLPRCVIVPRNAHRLASDLHVRIGRPDGHIDVRHRFPHKGAAGVGDAGADGDQDGRCLRLGDVKSLHADGGLGRRSVLDVEQFPQGVQVFALCAAGDILVAGVVVDDPLLDDDVGHPLDEQLFRAGRLHADAGDLLIGGDQGGNQFAGVGAGKLMLGVSTH